jgi:hypothetical protein
MNSKKRRSKVKQKKKLILKIRSLRTLKKIHLKRKTVKKHFNRKNKMIYHSLRAKKKKMTLNFQNRKR